MTMLVLYSLLLIALAYVIGCILGCLARRFFSAKEEPRYVARAEDNRFGRPAAVAGGAAAAAGVAAVAATAAKPKPAPAPKPAPVAKAAPAPKVVAKPKPAAKKPAAKKPAAAKPTGGATQANIKASAVEMKIPKAQAAKAAEADAAGKRPLVLGAPLGSGKDNLKRVKGIGPVNEKNLNGLGIYHFSQISAWKQKEADWVGTFLAFPGRIDREDWISQAKLLAAGKDTEFSKRVDKGQVGSSKGKK
ncbi:MAG: proton-conducting membrane transporter [Hyphomicrobiales bacterium]